MSFEQSTRLYQIPLESKSKPTGGGTVTWQLPRTGLLSRVWLLITGSVSGSLSSPNALGMASIVSRVRLIAQGGQDIFNLSGAGYHYLYRPTIDLGIVDNLPNNARAAVTATTFDVSMVLPVQINMRDPAGLIALQNDQTLVTLSLDFLADASVATGATVTATVTPYLDLFTVPTNPADFPKSGVSVLHQVLEDHQAVSGAVDYTYEWQRGATALKTIHGAGIGASGSDAWSRIQVKANESQMIMDHNTGMQDKWQYFLRKASRIAGTIVWDGMASSGLGNYSLFRDGIDTRKLSRLTSVITATGATTLYTVRETALNLLEGK